MGAGARQRVVVSPPAASVGMVDVLSGADALGSRPNPPADQFIYSPPVITSVSPSSGPVTGGTTVNIRGSGFPSSTIYGIVPPNSQVSFGNAAAPIESCIDTGCTVQSPPGAQVGPVNITVTAFGGSSAPSVFTYNAYPVLAQFQLPDPFFQTAGFVALDGSAPAPRGALITLTSSDPTAVVLGPAPNVTIPAGSLSTPITLTFLPASTTEDVTLTATYGNSSLDQD